jgi:hypothetical protein
MNSNILEKSKSDLKEQIRTILAKYNLPSDKDFLYRVSLMESLGGKYLTQIGGGPALGWYQIEPPTAIDIMRHIRTDKLPESFQNLIKMCLDEGLLLEILLTHYLEFQTVIARLHLMRFREAIPVGVLEQGKYWKKYWNTNLGKGTIEKWLIHQKENS